MTFEYFIFNLSSLNSKNKCILPDKTFNDPSDEGRPENVLEAFNYMGSRGWHFVTKLTDSSYLFERSHELSKHAFFGAV